MQFLRRNANKAFIEVMVEMVSREVRLYGPKAYIDKMEELVEARFAYNCYNALYREAGKSVSMDLKHT